jgi:hypothetical protein
MPKGLPTPAQLWEGDISFFSIDTDLIQAAGYNFGRGALHQLPQQLPASMGLQLPEVVVREIVKHRMAPVLETLQQFKSASGGLQRLAAIDMSAVDKMLEDLTVADAATERFKQEVHAFAESCRGGVLPIAGADALPDLFEAYFTAKPPFGLRKDKKAEFPDALCLWLLDEYARDNDTKGILASGDDGWRAYAEDSDRLYLVKSVEELAALFKATTEHADAIKAKIAAMVGEAGSALRQQLDAALGQHASDSDWDASEIYSGSGRVEPSTYDADVLEYATTGDINIWSVQGEPTTWVVELTATVKVNVHVEVEFFVWDSIDREELSMGSQTATKEEEIEVEVFLTCSDVHLDTPADDWQIDVEIARGHYSLEGFEVELDYGRDE